MRNKDAFSSYHPINNFIYYILILILSFLIKHPVCICISAVTSFAYFLYLNKKLAIKSLCIFIIPVVFLIVILNPIFNHQGMTILKYLPSNNPLTLESIIGGIAAAIILASRIIWFQTYCEIMTTDKFVYIFGKIVPPLSLVVSMCLRFVPKFKEHWNDVIDAQLNLGRDKKNGSLIQRLKLSIRILSITISWSIENAIDSASSMKSRGYGTEKRTAFSIYSFDQRDKEMIIWIIFCSVFILIGIACKGIYFRYYPNIKGVEFNAFTISYIFVYLLLCLTPLIVDVKEDIVWKHIQSKI